MEPEALNKKALDIVQRVRDKLTGKDFNTEVGPLMGFSSLFTILIFPGELRGLSTSGAPDQPGHKSRKSLSVLHWLVSLLVNR